jgi:hypothetical protein
VIERTVEDPLPAGEKGIVLRRDRKTLGGFVANRDFAAPTRHHRVGNQLSVDPEPGVERTLVHKLHHVGLTAYANLWLLASGLCLTRRLRLLACDLRLSSCFRPLPGNGRLARCVGLLARDFRLSGCFRLLPRNLGLSSCLGLLTGEFGLSSCLDLLTGNFLLPNSFLPSGPDPLLPDRPAGWH